MFESGNYSDPEGTVPLENDDSPYYYANGTDNSVYSSLFSSKVCQHWDDLNHIYFQIANVFFFLSYLAPNGTYGMLYLRCSLMVGCVFFALWSWAVKCYLDAVVWNLTFVSINFVYICSSLFYMRPYKFQKEIEEVSWCWLLRSACSSHCYRVCKIFWFGGCFIIIGSFLL